jgi:hypothetical protein
MKQEPFFITFNKPWFSEDDSVNGLLQRLDLGEKIPLSKFKEACKKEGIKFSIKIT